MKNFIDIKEYYVVDNREEMTCTCHIKAHGKHFIGVAYCHEKDKDFFSPILGGRIAHNRALIYVYKDFIEKEKYKIDCYNALLSNPSLKDNAVIIKKKEKSLKKINITKKEIRKTRADIKTTIENQDRVVKSVKEKRAKQNNPS